MLPAITIDPTPQFELSPHLYMQFMEPLGVTDGSVEAAWDHQTGNWREDVVEITKELAPGMVRWGGCLSSYYRWKESVGPREQRVPMHNLLWGGIESNQIGTAEFVDFCRRVDADALYCVNFESDGRRGWANPKVGGSRCAGPEEAAEWVAYCNREDDELRLSHGIKEPLTVPFWQIGNETSYDLAGMNLETAAVRTVAFAQAMRAVDPTIQLIGWGDSGWASRMADVAGEHLDALAFHHMFHPCPDDAILNGNNYRHDPNAAWDALMAAPAIHERKVLEARSQIEGTGLKMALTECHFDIPGRDRGDVMSSWAVGVSYARIANMHQRNGDLLKIATLSDFCGTRWQVNSVMIPTPGGKAYLLPVAQVMRLYRAHSGEHAVNVTGFPADLDVVASRTGNKLFLHVVNTRRDHSVTADIHVEGFSIAGGQVFEIAASPEVEVLQHEPDVLKIESRPFGLRAPHTFSAASVCVVELELG